MRATYKKCLGLLLISGLLLSLFYAWSPGTSSRVDIRSRQRGRIQKLLQGKIQDTISVYQDIGYHIKDDVARLVISQHVWILPCIIIFIFNNSLSGIFFLTVIWRKIHVCVGLMRTPFNYRSPIRCSHVCGPTTSFLHSWSPIPTRAAWSVTELRSTAAFRRGNTPLCTRVTVSLIHFCF